MTADAYGIPGAIWLEGQRDTRSVGAVFTDIWDPVRNPDPCLDGIKAKPRIEFRVARANEAVARNLGNKYYVHYLRLSAWTSEARGVDEAAANTALDAVEYSINALWGTKKSPGPWWGSYSLQWVTNKTANGRVYRGWATLPVDLYRSLGIKT